jgi:hypothetical protein
MPPWPQATRADAGHGVSEILNFFRAVETRAVIEEHSWKWRCHVERSETSLVYLLRLNSIPNSSEILRSARNDMFLVRAGDLDFRFPILHLYIT